jgi:hypothetical protein
LGGAGGGATGFVTPIATKPAEVKSLAVRFTSKDALFTNPVGRFVLLTVTTDCDTKLVPLSSNVALADPASVVVGDTELITGTLLGAGVMMNVRVVVVPPPGCEVNTATVALPGV